jgi:C2 domain
LSGRLSLRIHAVADVDHAATGRFSRGPETFVVVKVEDNFKARTRGTKNGRWTDEYHEIDIDKANEIELTVYDRTGDSSMPIGMLWIRILDIVEEQRRKKVEVEFQQAGWVSAGQVQGGSNIRPDMQFAPPPGQNPGRLQIQSQAEMQNPQGPLLITAWFALEPVGRIQLTLGFSKSST